MSINPIRGKQEVIDVVLTRCSQLKIEPLAILLHGSQVSGNAYDGSDWDVYVVAEFEVKPVRAEFMHKGTFVDLGFLKYVRGMSLDDFFASSKLVPAQKFDILWSKNEEANHFANKVIDALSSKYNRGERETWQDIRHHWLETYFLRNIDRISRCPDQLRRQVYISLYIDSITRSQYFHFTNQFNHSISEGYKMIKENDPKLYRLLVDLPRLSSQRALESNLTKIYQYFIKLDKDNPSTMGRSICADTGTLPQDKSCF